MFPTRTAAIHPPFNAGRQTHSCGKPVTMKHIAVLTGAGISTSAGIPDFRGPDGVWTKHPEQMSVYDIDSFLSDKEKREYSWRWQKESPVWNAQPGAAHKALVKLEKAGMLTLLATQNFDALHEKAGNSPDVIVNLHGTIGTSHCMKCHAKYDTADIMARLDEEPDPHCHRTLPYSGGMPCNGLIKTDVVYFGEALPDGAMEKSYKLASRADELWVIGGSADHHHEHGAHAMRPSRVASDSRRHRSCAAEAGGRDHLCGTVTAQ